MPRLAVAFLLSLASCSGAGQQEATAPASTASAAPSMQGPMTPSTSSTTQSSSAPAASAKPPPAGPSDPELVAAFAPRDLYHDHPTTTVLYTWTTAEQIDELRRTRKLLSRGESKTGGIAGFDAELFAEYDASPIARALLNPPLSMRRFAWASPWATMLGLGNEVYGDRLVRVVLRPEALFGRFLHSDNSGLGFERWAFFDMKGNPVATADALKQLHRLAAVYHVSTAADSGVGGLYREVVLCNEAMIASWSVGSAEVKAQIEADRAAIDLLGRYVATHREWSGDAQPASYNAAVTSMAWPRKMAVVSPEIAYTTALAFPFARYLPGRAQIKALGDALAALPDQGPSLVVEPPSSSTPVKVPPPLFQKVKPCRGDGTMGCIDSPRGPCRDKAGRVVACP